MNARNKLKYCSIIYTIIIVIIILLVFIYHSRDNYFRWGVPESNEEGLYILSVKIDNYYKYSVLLLLISVIRVVKVLVNEIAESILSFRIYNPDKIEIKDISKCELQFYGNYLYLIDSLRYVFTLMIIITQIDLALFGVLIDQITTVFSIRYLLNEKKFINVDERYEEIEEI